MATEETYNECINIIEDKKKFTHKELKDKWTIFNNKFPKLYDMLITTEIVDLNMLKYLCDMAKKQIDLSKDEKLEVEFKIGDKLATEYLYNQFPEPSQKQKEFIKESIRKKMNNEEN
jgi:hypothetical protein